MKKRVLIIFLIFLILLVIPFAHALSLNGVLSEFFNKISGKATTANLCSDSDSGLDYYTLGTVSASTNFGLRRLNSRTDRCINTGTIQEFYCDNFNNLKYKSYTCPNGCSGGACVNEVTIPTCTPNIVCSDWGDCMTITLEELSKYPGFIPGDQIQRRECTDTNNCGNVIPYTNTIQKCTQTKPIVLKDCACSDSDGFNYYTKGFASGTFYEGTNQQGLVEGCIIEDSKGQHPVSECTGEGCKVIEYLCQDYNNVDINSGCSTTSKMLRVDYNSNCPQGCKDGVCIKETGGQIKECWKDSDCKTVCPEGTTSYYCDIPNNWCHCTINSQIIVNETRILNFCKEISEPKHKDTRWAIEITPENVYYKIFLSEGKSIPIKGRYDFHSACSNFLNIDTYEQQIYEKKLDELSLKYDFKIGEPIAFLLWDWGILESEEVPKQLEQTIPNCAIIKSGGGFSYNNIIPNDPTFCFYSCINGQNRLLQIINVDMVSNKLTIKVVDTGELYKDISFKLNQQTPLNDIDSRINLTVDQNSITLNQRVDCNSGPIVELTSEWNTCIFKGSNITQTCYSNGIYQGSCSGVGSCIIHNGGLVKENLTWKSTCGGYGYTTIDGIDESIEFDCNNSTIYINQTISKFYRYSYWACQDGYKEVHEDPTSCKSSDTWQKYAEQSCINRCSTQTGKCGINSFSVSNECTSSQPQQQCYGTSQTIVQGITVCGITVVDVDEAETKCIVEYVGKTYIVDKGQTKTMDDGTIIGVIDVTAVHESGYPYNKDTCIISFGGSTIPTQQCNGCLIDNKCMTYGVRSGKQFCDMSGQLVMQKADNSYCKNNYECSSNICINNKCVNISLWNRFVRYFSRWFSR